MLMMKFDPDTNLYDHYIEGNSWGSCEDGSQGMGCGAQENFINCADIAIKANDSLKKI